MSRSYLAALLGLALLMPNAGLAQSPAQKAAVAAKALSPAERALVDQASAYLEGLSQAKGRFLQTDARGGQIRGDLFLQRPGKVRFAYDAPRGLIVVSDGYNVSVADSRLKTFDKYPLGATPLALLLARHVRLDQGVVIDKVIQTGDGFSIQARDGRKQAEGKIELVFANSPLTLRSWTVSDAQGQSTRVEILELKPVSGLSASLFQLRDPRVLPTTRR